ERPAPTAQPPRAPAANAVSSDWLRGRFARDPLLMRSLTDIVARDPFPVLLTAMRRSRAAASGCENGRERETAGEWPLANRSLQGRLAVPRTFHRAPARERTNPCAYRVSHSAVAPETYRLPFRRWCRCV